MTFPIATPGEMTRLRFGGHFRARDKRDRWDVQVSFDGGKTFKTVDTLRRPDQGKCKYTTVSDVPAGTKAAQIRWSRRTAQHDLPLPRADRRRLPQPCGGFRPVKITYVWEEGGIEKQDVHVAANPQETYTIRCQSKPEMKSIVLELAK